MRKGQEKSNGVQLQKCGSMIVYPTNCTALCISPCTPKFFRCRSIWVWLWCGIKFVTTSRLLSYNYLRTCLALSGHRSTRRFYSAIRQILSSNFRVPDICSMKATLQITVHSLIQWRVKMPKNGNDFQILIRATSESTDLT